MRQRGERGYREDWRERGRSFGGHRSGMGGRGDWEQRGQGQNRPYDEEYDELQNRGGDYGRDYGREWNEDDRERGGFDEQSLDEGRFQQYGHGTGRAGGGNREGRFGQRQSENQSYSTGRFGSEQGWYGGQSGYGDATGYGRQQGFGGQRGSQERFGRQGGGGQSSSRQFDQGGYGENRTGDRNFGGIFPQESHSGKGPQGYRRSDERIREDICDCLTDHPEIDPSNIEVKVENCSVTLSGTVDNRAAKRLAEDIAEGVGGVQDVRNEIRVQREQNKGEQTATAFGARHGNESESTRQKQGK